MDYIRGNLVSADELAAEMQLVEAPAAYCFRCNAFINNSWEAWVCVDCWDNYMEWAKSYGWGGTEAMARAKAEHQQSSGSPT